MNVPQLRFKEFSGELSWEKKRLDALGEFKNGLNKGKEDFGFGSPFVNLMDVFGTDTIQNKFYDLVNASETDLKNYNLLKGDVLFIRSSVKLEGVGQAAVIVEKLENTVYSGFLIRFREFSKSIELHYKKYCFAHNSFRKKVLALSTTSANTNINQDSLSQLTINLPSLPEQTKIANFLTTIDERINQLTRKKELMTQYKQGVMQQIFSQQLRFKDDNGEDFGDWEEKKLGELCKITTGKLDANAMVAGGKYRFYTCAKDFYHIDKYAFDTNALLISGNGANVGYIHHFNGKFNAYQRTYVLDGFNDNIIFVKFYLDLKLSARIATEKKEGNTPYIVMNTLTDMPIFLPCIPEQTKIAHFLTALDEKIQHITQQIEATKQYKQGLLQQMFV